MGFEFFKSAALKVFLPRDIRDIYYKEMQTRVKETEETIVKQNDCHSEAMAQYNKLTLAIKNSSTPEEDKAKYIELRERYAHALEESDKVLAKLHAQLGQFGKVNDKIQHPSSFVASTSRR